MRVILYRRWSMILRLGGSLLLALCLRASDAVVGLAPGLLITHGPASSRRIALTFDDGPGPATEELLSLLRRHNVHATFFVLGEQAQRRPATVKRLVDLGHEVGSHTFDHQNYSARARAAAARAKARGGSAAEAQAEVERCLRDDFLRSRAVIENCSGTRLNLCRMPYGIDRPWVKQVARETGFTLVNWTYGADWKAGSVKQLLPGYRSAIRPGAILLFHDGRKDATTSLAVVEAVIKAAKERGFEIVTVSRLLQSSQLPEPQPAP